MYFTFVYSFDLLLPGLALPASAGIGKLAQANSCQDSLSTMNSALKTKNVCFHLQQELKSSNKTLKNLV